MEEDLNKIIDDEYSIDMEDLDELNSDYSLPNVSEEMKQFLEFIQAVKDDNISYVEILAIDMNKFTKCKI
jgi:hypothetical protein